LRTPRLESIPDGVAGAASPARGSRLVRSLAKVSATLSGEGLGMGVAKEKDERESKRAVRRRRSRPRGSRRAFSGIDVDQ